MGRLFGRRVIVQLGTEDSTGTQYKDLRVTFDVKATDGSTPNEAKISIYNISPGAVSVMQQDDAVVRLLVGYRSDGDAPRALFEGNPISGGVKQTKNGVDRILSIEAQDGGKAYTTSHISVSFSTGTTTQQMFDTLAQAMGRPLGNIDGVVGDISLDHGIVLTGPVRDQLDQVAAMSDALWQFRDGALQVWSRGGSTGEPAVVFSSEAGNLIGSARPMDDGVEITGLLAPTLRPGKPFRVESNDVTGDFVATEVAFSGDSGWSKPFYVVAKGTSL